MVNERKSKKEVEADALKAIEEAEALKAKEDNETASDDPQDDEKTDEVVEDEVVTPSKSEDKDEEADDTEEEKKTVVEPTKAKDKPPVKSPEEIEKELEEKNRKLKASAQESIILHSTNKKIQESIMQASEMPLPTDEEMITKFSNWEDLDDFSQKMARENEWNSRKIQAVTSVSQEFRDYNAWEARVNEFVTDPKTITDTPLLDGKEEEFKKFAMKPTRRNVDFEDLVRSFLYDEKQTVTHKGSMLDTTSAKPKVAKDNSKLTVEQGRQLRETDYKTWLEYSKAGKIASAF